MKHATTFLLVLMMGTGMAVANPVAPAAHNKTNPSKPAATVAAMQQLQEENQQLKARLAKLENQMEEQLGYAHYSLTMTRILTALRNAAWEDRLEDMKALANYNALMGKTIAQLRAANASTPTEMEFMAK